MGSSSGDDYSAPPMQPAPPGNLISPMGSSTPFNPHFTNFLGDPNTPSTGLTPQMLAEIAGMNGLPPGGGMGGMGGGGGMPAGPGAAPRDPRVALAAAMAALPKGQGNITMAGGAPRRFAEGGGGQNRGGYGTSAGGRYG